MSKTKDHSVTHAHDFRVWGTRGSITGPAISLRIRRIPMTEMDSSSPIITAAVQKGMVKAVLGNSSIGAIHNTKDVKPKIILTVFLVSISFAITVKSAVAIMMILKEIMLPQEIDTAA